MPANADGEPTPILVVIGADDPSPFLSISTVCARCRAVVATRQIDVRLVDLDDLATRPADAAIFDAAAWLAHRCGPKG